MRAWLVSVLATSLLLGDGATGRVATRTAATSVEECTVAPSLSPADCLHLVERLARFADAAYGDEPTAAPPSEFRPASLAGVSLAAGRYSNGSATALVTTVPLDQGSLLIVGFGGTQDPATWLADLRNINAPYRAFQPLVRAIEAHAASGGQVILVGHSFGGAMVQLFMFAHATDASYRAVTFGSPGALPEPGVFGERADPRIANFVIAADPYAFLGQHRAEVAAHARRDRIYALALAGAIAHESGLSLAEVVSSEPFLAANYVNNGAKVILPSRRPGLSVSNVIAADPDEHEIETYVKRLRSANG